MIARLAMQLRATRRERGHRGFTLIEVLLAVGILASIVAITWGSISSSFRLRRITLDKFERYRIAQSALDRMARELSTAFITNIGQEATNERGEITYQTTFKGEDDRIDFTSLSHVRMRADDRASEQCEISYFLDRQRDEDGRMVQNLIRREDAPIDDDPERGGVMYALLEDVENIRFEYWDETREIAGEAWVRSWDAVSDHEGKLPSRIRITIEIPHPTLRNRELTFATQTEVHLTDPIIIVPAHILESAEQQQQLIQAVQEQDPQRNQQNDGGGQ